MDTKTVSPVSDSERISTLDKGTACPEFSAPPEDAPEPACSAIGDKFSFCPHFHHAVELLGRRWTGVVLRAMLLGATRYSDIHAAVPALSSKMLSERLKELEAEGVIERTVVPTTPVRIEYHLTEKGRTLDVVIAALAAWSERWQQDARL